MHSAIVSMLLWVYAGGRGSGTLPIFGETGGHIVSFDNQFDFSIMTYYRSVERDNRTRMDIDVDESEDPEDLDMERDQIAMCKLVLKLLQNEDGRRIMLECGGAESFEEFGSSHMRQRSEWYLRFLIGAILPKLERT